MKAINKLISILFFFALTLNIYADDFKYSSQTCVPPNPNQSSLSRYIDVPVNLYRGLTSINIPIYTIQGSSMNIPIDINYHASGIKVQDIGSWVGLGWSLNAGGFVSRVMRGLPDESENGYFKQTNDELNSPSSSFLDDIVNNRKDGEPDIFYFQAPGISGRFTIDINGDVTLIPYQQIKIIPAIGSKGIGYWKIIDSKGNVYEFGKTSQSQESSSSKLVRESDDTKKTYISTWYLDLVCTALNQQELKCTYEIGANYSYKYYNQQYIGSISGDINWNYAMDASIEIIVINPKYLSRIDFLNGKIELARESRTDLLAADQVNNIKISNANRVIKEFNLKYENYVNGSESRSMLKEVNEVGTPGYKLDYYKSEKLPARNSYNFDSWGYYYGSLEKVEAYSLKSITLPTGSKKEFIYEVHNYNKENADIISGGLRIKRIFSDKNYTEYNYYRDNSSTGQLYVSPKYSYSYNVSYQTLVCDAINCKSPPAPTCCLPYYINYCYSSVLRVPINQIYDIEGFHIGYSHITEINENGSIEYNYYNYSDYSDIWAKTEELLYPTSYYWKRGMLKNKLIYNKALKSISKSEYEYNFDNVQIKSQKQVKGFISGVSYGVTLYNYSNPDIISNNLTLKSKIETTYNIEYPNDETKALKCSTSYIYNNIRLLNSEIINNSSEILTSKFKYVSDFAESCDESNCDAIAINNFNDCQTREYNNCMTCCSGDMSTCLSQYAYQNCATVKNSALAACDALSDKLICSMINNNLIAYPVEKQITITKSGGIENIIGGDLTIYKNYGTALAPLILPSEQKQIALSSPSSNTKLVSLKADYSFDYHPSYVTSSKFDSYDSNGNLLQLHKINSNGTDGQYNSFLYSGPYKIAEAINAKYSDIFHTSFEDVTGTESSNAKTGKKVMNSNYYNSLTGLSKGKYTLTYWKYNGSSWNYIKSSPDIDLSSTTVYAINITGVSSTTPIDEVRFYPVDAQMTTYTYEPLVGVTSQTDVRNQTTYYEYDDMGRLSKVKDANKSLLKEKVYNYAGSWSVYPSELSDISQLGTSDVEFNVSLPVTQTYSISSLPSWAHYTKTTEGFTLNIDENPCNGAARTGNIILTSTGYPNLSIKLSQDARDKYYVTQPASGDVIKEGEVAKVTFSSCASGVTKIELYNASGALQKTLTTNYYSGLGNGQAFSFNTNSDDLGIDVKCNVGVNYYLKFTNSDNIRVGQSDVFSIQFCPDGPCVKPIPSGTPAVTYDIKCGQVKDFPSLGLSVPSNKYIKIYQVDGNNEIPLLLSNINVHDVSIILSSSTGITFKMPDCLPSEAMFSEYKVNFKVEVYSDSNGNNLENTLNTKDYVFMPK